MPIRNSIFILRGGRAPPGHGDINVAYEVVKVTTKLPCNIVIRREKTTFYFPLVTSLLWSVVLNFVMWLVGRR